MKEICLDYQKGMVAFLKANPKLKLAVLAGYWASYQNGIATMNLGSTALAPRPPTRPAWSFEQVLEKVGGVDLDKAHEFNGTRWLLRGETSLAMPQRLGNFSPA